MPQPISNLSTARSMFAALAVAIHVARMRICHAAVADIKAIDNGEAESPRTLDKATRHVEVYIAQAE